MKMTDSLCVEGKCSLFSFVVATSVCLTPILCSVIPYSHWFIAIHIIIYNFSLILYFTVTKQWKLYQVSVRGGLLGSVFGLGVLLCFIHPQLTHFGWYMITLAFFHWSEYFTTAVTNPRTLVLDSYILDHSLEYKLAAMLSWIEFFVEYHYFPFMKTYRVISILGLALSIFGETLRKASMMTACTNFNHYVQRSHNPNHVLVTHGVYSWCRHPSYVGWFAWSIGTQLILCNPVCLVAYTVVSWRFFNERIFTEEIYLHSFFGDAFEQYQRRVRTGIPFIRGFHWRY